MQHSPPKRDAAFIEPMECLAEAKLSNGADWVYELSWTDTGPSRSTRMPSCTCIPESGPLLAKQDYGRAEASALT
jgi:hypothetical protein